MADVHWGAAPMRRVEYDEALEPIDRELVALWAERLGRTQGVPMVPPPTMVDAWSQKHGVPAQAVRWLFQTLSTSHRPREPVRLGPLEGIVHLMQRQVVDGCRYTLTHIEQYGEGSIVHLVVELVDPPPLTQLELGSTLTVDSVVYAVQPRGWQGGGSRVSAQFLVTPALPQDVSAIRFALRPGGGMHRTPQVVRTVEDTVEFS